MKPATENAYRVDTCACSTIVLLFMTLLSAQSAVATRFVSTTGSDVANDCASSSSPCATLQHAVDLAAPGEEVRVAAGTYSGSQVVRVTRFSVDYDYTQVVFIDKELTIRGGYSEADWTISDPVVNVTTIDAAGDGRPVTIVDTLDAVLVLDGFTLTGGDYTGLGNPAGTGDLVCRSTGVDCGGGLYVYWSALHLLNSSVSGNVASVVGGDGGGIYLWGARTTMIENTTVAGNDAPYRGGGLYVTEQLLPLTIRSTTFDDNAADRGGGVDLATNIDALVTLEDSVLVGNTAETGDGGGLYARLTEDGLVLELDRVVVQSNQAWGQGKGVFLDAAGPVVPEARLVNVRFSGNGRVVGAPEAAQDAVLAVAPNFTSLEVTLAHVTAADNPVGSFLYARPDIDAGRTLLVTAANVLVTGFENGYVGEETGLGELTIEHTNTLFYNVMNNHLAVAGTPTFTAVGSVTGAPLLDGNYRLQAGSAAIDAGVDAGINEDLDGDYRPQGAAPDIGADELYQLVVPASVTLGGPATVFLEAAAEFTAELGPADATQPVTYTWEATGLPPVVHVGGLADSLTLAWSTAGSKTIQVTATNDAGTISDSFVTEVERCMAVDLVLADQTVTAPPRTFIGCSSVTAGPNVAIDAGAEATFLAGTRVILRNGFSVASGAAFTAALDVSLLGP